MKIGKRFFGCFIFSIDCGNSSTYFICLLGERYGWHHKPDSSDQLLTRTFNNAIKHGHTWLERYMDRSITELEVLHAALDSEVNKHSTSAPSLHSIEFVFTRSTNL